MSIRDIFGSKNFKAPIYCIYSIGAYIFSFFLFQSHKKKENIENNLRKLNKAYKEIIIYLLSNFKHNNIVRSC